MSLSPGLPTPTPRIWLGKVRRAAGSARERGPQAAEVFPTPTPAPSAALRSRVFLGNEAAPAHQRFWWPRPGY